MLIWEIVFWGLFVLFIQSTNLLFFESGHFSFQRSDRLIYLLICIPIALLYIYNLYKTEKIVGLAGEKIKSTIFKSFSIKKSFVSYFLFRNSVALLIIAFAKPAFGTQKVAGQVKSMELVVCLDISNSMNTKDIRSDLSRLDISKRAVNDLINQLGGEKIGLCLFANDAFIQLPLTLDYEGAKLFVNSIETNMISSQGTNIKRALETAYTMYSENSEMSKALLLITDGESHEGNPDEIIQKFVSENIQTAVLGIGTTKGGLVPKDPNRPALGYKKNSIGQTVQSRLNPNLIQQIARKARGLSEICQNEYPNLRRLMTAIQQLEKQQIKSELFEVKKQRYQIPLALSFILFVFYLVWTSSNFKLTVKR